MKNKSSDITVSNNSNQNLLYNFTKKFKMKKTQFALFLMAFISNFAFGQITLEHSFSSGFEAYTNANETFYYSVGEVNEVKIYNSDYTLKNQFILPQQMYIQSSKYTLSKNIFNLDNLLEIVVLNINDNGIKIYNENGLLIKDFGSGCFFGDYNSFQVFHDSTTQSNKLTILKTDFTTVVYDLGTNSLATKELQNRNNLSAFPIPTNKILNIVNPNNGNNSLQVYDENGKIVINKLFTNSEKTISLDVEFLPNGLYLYKIGNFSSKFLKN